MAMVGHTHPIGDFQLVRHCVQEVWECGDPAAATKYYDSTYLRCGPSDFEYVKGIEGVQSLIIAYHLAFRGLKLVVDESTHCGRWVCTRITVSGTHTGNFAGIAGSGKHVVFTMDCRDRVFEGKIINSRIYYDIS